MPSMPYPVALFTLVLVTLLWGSTFAVIKGALATVPVPLLMALRFSLAALLFVWVPFDRRALRPALLLGLIAFAGYATQTIGLELTTASKAAFLTALNVILAPMVARLLYGDRVAPRVWLAAVLALIGLGLMTLRGEGGVTAGDLWVVGTALSYALYIVYLGAVAGGSNALALAGMQQLPVALLAWLWAIPHLDALPSVPTGTWLAIIYLAAIATALVTVLQTYAQRVVPATVAALLFALEPVFAAIIAFALLGETLGTVGWIGGGVVLLALMVSELKLRRPRRSRAVASGD